METSRKTTDELLELLKQKKSFMNICRKGRSFVDMGLPNTGRSDENKKDLKRRMSSVSPSWTESMRTRYSPARESPTGINYLPLDLGWKLSIEEIQKDAEDIRISDSVCKEQKRQHHLFGPPKKDILSEVNELLYEMHENIIE